MRLELPSTSAEIQVYTGVNPEPIPPGDPDYDPEDPTWPMGYWVWLKPAGAKIVQVTAIGGGGGGGGGRRGATGSLVRGGWGGGGGAWVTVQYPADTVPDEIRVYVAAGATGGDAATADDTDGVNAQQGGMTEVGTILRGIGGFAGVGGTSTHPTLDTGQDVSPASLFAAAGPNPEGAGDVVLGCPNGGAGATYGGPSTSPGSPVYSDVAAGNGGTSALRPGGPARVSGGSSDVYGAGAGGAGGTYGTVGMDGGNYGAGGGGGGASLNGTDSGAGGRGGDGVAVIVTYF